MSIRGTLSAAILCSLVSTLMAGEDQYVRPKLLIEPSALAKPQPAQRYIILDARAKPAYEKGHIPGALWVDHDMWKSAFGEGNDADGWGRRIGTLGIGGDSTVVVYDDRATTSAARIWWLLRYWGVSDARLLNGGWKSWCAEGLPTEAHAPPAAQAVTFTATAQRERLATKDQIRTSLADRSLQIVDARSNDEFCGIDKKDNTRGGAIPGAKHLEWSDLIDPASGRFKPPAELRQLFDTADIDLKKPTASHCQSGGRASVMAFAMDLMGARDSRNYFPGWSEWGNLDGLPLVAPKPE